MLISQDFTENTAFPSAEQSTILQISASGNNLHNRLSVRCIGLTHKPNCKLCVPLRANITIHTFGHVITDTCYTPRRRRHFITPVAVNNAHALHYSHLQQHGTSHHSCPAAKCAAVLQCRCSGHQCTQDPYSGSLYEATAAGQSVHLYTVSDCDRWLQQPLLPLAGPPCCCSRQQSAHFDFFRR